MSAYATVADLEARYRALSEDEAAKAGTLLEDASAYVDAYLNGREVADTIKQVVVCNIVKRMLATGDIPYQQQTMSAGVYSQTFSLSGNGTGGAMFLTRADRVMLGGGGSSIGFAYPSYGVSDV